MCATYTGFTIQNIPIQPRNLNDQLRPCLNLDLFTGKKIFNFLLIDFNKINAKKIRIL